MEKASSPSTPATPRSYTRTMKATNTISRAAARKGMLIRIDRERAENNSPRTLPHIHTGCYSAAQYASDETFSDGVKVRTKKPLLLLGSLALRLLLLLERG